MKKIFAVVSLAAELASSMLGFQTIPFQITTASVLPNAAVGAPYSVTIAASGGTGNYLWFQGSPGLPAGLGMDADTGAITGIPAIEGGLITGAAQAQTQFTIIVQLKDTKARTQSEAL